MTERPVFTGVATALATPFDESGIDEDAFLKMIDFQLENGADALVVCGTTGEAPTLTRAERQRLVSLAAGRAGGRIPVIAGAGANDTRISKQLALDAARAGADALLLVTPYYNKCTQKGLVSHYRAVSESANLPFIAYNVPSRTGMRILPGTAREIAGLALAAGLKDAGGDITETAKTMALCGDAFPVYCGSDELTLPFLSLGGKGVISVVSNLRPAEVKSVCDLFFAGKAKEAAREFAKLLPLAQALFREVNPIPLKAALAAEGRCKNVLRAPLTPLSPENEKALLELL